MKKLFLLAFAVAAFTACSEKENVDPNANFDVISFEPAERMLDQMSGSEVALGDLEMALFDGSTLNYKNVFCAQAYASDSDFDGPLFSDADQNIFFGSYYPKAYDTWGGFSVSQNVAMTGDAANLMPLQFSAYAKGGACATKTFAACYDSNTPSEGYVNPLPEYGYPTIDLIESRIPAHVYVANSSYNAVYYKGKANKTFKVKISGSLGGAAMKTVEVELVGNGSIREGWQLVSLESLGEVDKIVFKAVVDDVSSDPSYFCIDEIAFVKQTAK